MIHFYSKKTLVLLAILLTNIGLRAANYDFKDNGVYYIINGTTVSVTAGDTKYSGTVTIPATITNSGTTYTVTSIASNCFYECTNLEEVKLGANVTSIGYRAFYGCYNLTSINLNDKIKTLSDQAFSGCTSLKSVTLGANLTEMGTYVFNGCSALRTVDIHEGCEIIAQGAFYGCNKLQSVVIPNSVLTVDGSAFDGCTSLTTATIGDGVKNITNSCFYDCTSLEEVKLGTNVTSIGYRAFYGCYNLTSIYCKMKKPCTLDNSNTQAFPKLSQCTVYVPIGTRQSYIDAGWKEGEIFKEVVDYDNREEQSMELASLPNMTYGDKAYTLPSKTTEGLTLKWISSNTKVATISGNTLTVKGAGKATITAKQEEGDDTYKPFSKEFTLTVAKAALTITAKDYTIKQGEALPTFGASYTGFKNGETESVLTQKPTFSCSATSASAPGTYDITVSNATAQNYDIKYAKGTLTIVKADGVVVTAKNYTRKYGEANPTFEYTSTGATLNGTPALSCTATATSPVGSYDIVVSKGSVQNYNATYVNGTLTITKAPLTITAKNYTIKQGEALPTFDASYTGFKNGETKSVLTKQPTFVCSATSASAPGTYDITVSGAEAKNYDIKYAKGTLTIVKADGVVVTAKNYMRKYGEANPTFEYTSTGATLNGTPVLSCTATATSPVGTYPIVVNKGSVKNYNASFVNGTLTITKASLTIAAKDYTIKQGEALPTFDASYTGFKNGETKSVLTKQPTFVCSATSASAPGTYDITVSGAEAKNYDITYTKGTLTIEESAVEPVITDGNCIDGIYYKFYNGNMTAEVISGENKYTGDIVIPRSVKYNGSTYAVTDIGEEAFYYCNGLTSVTIPRSITSIDERAFHGCGDLLSLAVESGNLIYDSREGCNAIIETASKTLIAGGRNSFIPDGITSIGGGAFSYNKGLTSITIPESVTSIGWTAFEETGLTSVAIPESVTSIGSFAFTGTDITSVSIPKSVTYIGQGAFSRCQNLTSVQVEEGNPVYDSRGNCNAIIETASNTLIEGWEFSSIPNSITSLGEGAFSGCYDMKSFNIPSSVTRIGSEAFWGCGLTSVSIPESVTSIGTYAFYCTSLKSMYCYGKTAPKTEGEIFFDVNLNRVTLFVPEESIDAYKAKEPWKSFGNIIAINEKTFISGDANGDGGVNVFDVTATVNYILGSPSTGFDSEAADVNDDGSVNVFDVTKLVNIILGVDDAGAKMRKAEGLPEMDKLYLEDFEIEPGEEKEVNILLDNPNAEYRDLQFDLYLPEGISVVQDEDEEFLVDTGSRCTKKHTIGFSYTDGHYVCMLYSTAKNPLTGNSGDIMTITLKADEGVTPGAKTGFFRNVSLSKTDATGPTYDEFSFDVTVAGDADGIEDIIANDATYQIYTIDGKQVDAMQKGVNIIRYPNGATKKVYVK